MRNIVLSLVRIWINCSFAPLGFICENVSLVSIFCFDLWDLRFKISKFKARCSSDIKIQSYEPSYNHILFISCAAFANLYIFENIFFIKQNYALFFWEKSKQAILVIRQLELDRPKEKSLLECSNTQIINFLIILWMPPTYSASYTLPIFVFIPLVRFDHKFYYNTRLRY